MSSDDDKKVSLKVMSLFAGCGGMDLGFVMAQHPKYKYEIVWANDFDRYACATYRKNFNVDIYEGDIWDVVLQTIIDIGVHVACELGADYICEKAIGCSLRYI
ncbi:MAG: DNA cytosine methyltransferase [Thermoprotei archaeon]